MQKNRWFYMIPFVCFCLLLFVPAQNYQKTVADAVLRLHIVANSNSFEDQQLKLKVRDQVVEDLDQKLALCKTRDQSRAVVEDELENIKRTAQKCVWENGYDYKVSVRMDETWFPVKTYGDLTFPRGFYEALVVELGRGGGRNWWCVLFPSLCFTDAVTANVPQSSRQQIYDTVGADAAEALMEGEKVEIRFKIAEIIENLFAQ